MYFRLNEDMVWKLISDIQGDNLTTLLEKALAEYEFELAEYDNDHIYYETHNIIKAFMKRLLIYVMTEKIF